MRLDEILPTDMQETMAAAFAAMDWAEDEIEAARIRHGETALKGPIHRLGFLAVKQADLIWSELFFRAHCREMLDRIAAGAPLEPGTDAEILYTLHRASLLAPMASGVDCLYHRLFRRIMPQEARKLEPQIDLAAYESVHGSAADQHESELRKKLSRKRGE